MSRNRTLHLLPVAAFFLLISFAAAAASFTASLDRDTITLGESATLSLTFEGGSPSDVPSPPDVPGLQVTYVGQSSQFNFNNGQQTSTLTHSFTLTPQQTGEFIIPSLIVSVGGQQLSSQPVKLTVLKPGAPTPAAVNSGSEAAFLKLLVPKKEVYPGEVITAGLELYLRQDVQNAGNFQLTPLSSDGFTAGKTVEGQRSRAQIGNFVYTVIPFSIALTVQKTGKLKLGPVTASVVLVLPSGNSQPNPFGFPDPFGQFGGEQKQVSLATDAGQLQALPLPAENAPPNFNGAVGNYTMTVTAGPTNVAVGDPITIRIQISGRGALDALELPGQPAWRDFKIYPPTSKTEFTDNLGIEGTKTFEQIVTPENTDVHQLPPFSFSFFDPDAKTFRTLTQPALQLAVHSGGSTPVPMVAAAKSAASGSAQPQDILPIMENFGAPVQIRPPLITRPAFLALQGVPVLAWLAVCVRRRRADNLANNPRLRRQRAVAQLIAGGLTDLNRFAAENKPNEFFAMLFRLLQEQLGERLDCPAASITEADADMRLVQLGANPATLDALRELFQLCNQARYAPIQTRQELAAVAAKFKKAAVELQNLKA